MPPEPREEVGKFSTISGGEYYLAGPTCTLQNMPKRFIENKHHGGGKGAQTIGNTATKGHARDMVNLEQQKQKQKQPQQKSSRTETNFPSTRHAWRIFLLHLLSVTLLLAPLTWFISNSIPLTIISVFIVPLIVVVQGSLLILGYRREYAKAPHPIAFSHGIVKCHHQASTSCVGKPCNDFLIKIDECEKDVPLRLLVIGDSMAVGVGQSNSSTPVFPESLAKSLSRNMGGRPVLWTAHGVPGASAGWVVRELERAAQHGQFVPPNVEASAKGSSIVIDMGDINQRNKTNSENDSFQGVESPSDDSSSLSDKEARSWQEQLHAERVHFDPNTLGPFDIAIVCTGTNDLKATFFPFLVAGEESEFRRQAQEGGGFGNELTRILRVLKIRMNQGLRTMRENVKETQEKIQESIKSATGKKTTEKQSSDDIEAQNNNASLKNDVAGGRTTPKDKLLDEEEGTAAIDDNSTGGQQDLFPMVVLPGIPARALPVFQYFPLRWLAVPIFTIMDAHKHEQAERHRGEVLFVGAPSTDNMAEYKANFLPVSDCQEGQDKVLLNLKDIKRRHARRIENDMKEFFKKHPKNSHKNDSLFSVDGIHPNDEGYDFMAKFVADGIIQEWKRKQGSKAVLQRV